MSDGNNAVNMVGGIVGAGLALGALGLTLNFVSEMSKSNFTGNRKRKKSSGYDHDLMFGYGEHMRKSVGKKHKDVYDFGSMDW